MYGLAPYLEALVYMISIPTGESHILKQDHQHFTKHDFFPFTVAFKGSVCGKCELPYSLKVFCTE